ncbi:MAG: tRNA (adenosine(37)-N6)-threonylcarbamoyltransferase complex dimerization subunit type 1 TsaB [Marinilabiliaceae bacterium]|nr:tRNA (adenosine(37)-N6)-threonylcarbamoyltransferase complex dimerization subunit type 1 TsaB [Marinilabiliaceae bacterium]
MAKILCLETSTSVCSVALTDNGKLLFSEVEHSANSHSALLTVLIEKIIKQAKMEMSQIDAVAVSSGPGSYTGLRIGVSTAKGICYALQKPLIAITSLRILAQQAIILNKELLKEGKMLLCPMIDARRLEVFTALFDDNLNQIEEISAKIINSTSFTSLLEKQKIAFFGDGASKCKDIIQNKNAIFLENIHPLASAMATIAETLYHKNKFEDIAYFEPFYLKDFIAIAPKNKVLAN